MARPRKPSRLYLHPKERVWLIRDGSRFIRTGYAENQLAEAEKAHTEYNAGKFTARKRVSDPAALTVAEALIAYANEHAVNLKSAKAIGNDLGNLEPYFGNGIMLSEINADLCKGYATFRRGQGKWPNHPERQRREKPVSNGTIRRELAILAAAINYWHKNHGPLAAVPAVTLPPVSQGRDKYLEQDERVRLLAGALGFYQVIWQDVETRQKHVRWMRLRDRINYHLARFILLGVATGSRKGVILSARWIPNTVSGWVDIGKAVFHRRAMDEIETKKRKPPSALGGHIMAHLKRWKRIDGERRAAHIEAGGSPFDYQTIVHYRGREIGDIKRTWEFACELAYLPKGSDGFVRHTMRHTRATMLMRKGVDIWQAAGQLGMSPKLMQDRYGHHNPNFQAEAKEVR